DGQNGQPRPHHRLFPHFIRDLVFLTFFDQLVVSKGLYKPKPSEEDDENQHADNRNIVGFSDDCEKIL
ncbi:MAG TPA: hypothetical protein VKR81_16315, partial [Candidatus Binatia bacterium]|nr:hypothetical protein [Candidatus Binatia bacterium]